LERKTVLKERFKYRTRAARLFIAPSLVLTFVFGWYPLALAFVVGFQEYWILGARYVGFANFQQIANDPMVGIVLRNTLYYAFLNIALTFIVPIFVAILLLEMNRKIVRIMMILWFIPMASMASLILWKWMYDPYTGLFNGILVRLGLPTLLWLDDPRIAMLCIVLPNLIMYGPGLVYIASLQSIPDELYEAADLEGAGIWQKIWSITLPRLRPIIAMMLILAVIGAFQVFEAPFVMTGGGPANATRTIVMLIVETAFRDLHYGYGTALAIILFIILLVLITLQRKYFKENLDE